MAVLATVAIVTGTVFGRAFLQRGIPDAELIVQDLMVAAVLVPLAAVAGRRAHIGIDLFVRHLPARARRAIETVNAVLSLAFLLPILWSAWLNLRIAWVRESYYDGSLEIPEWPGRLVFLVGFAVFAARSIHRGFTDARPPAGGDAA